MKEKNDFKNLPESFWMASTPSANYPALTEDLRTDVAIIGGGMVGISCAYMLMKKGIKAAVLEADHILQGTTGHTTAKITSQHGLIYNKIKNQMSMEFAQQYADANESAIKIIENISKELHIDCDFEMESAFIFTNKEEYIQKINDEVKTAASLGIKASYADKIPFDIPIKAAVRFDNQAQFHPRKYLLALAKEITNNGCSIYEQTRAVRLEENHTYTITTSQGKKVTADKVIIATHYPFYNKSGMYFSRIYSDRSYVLAVKSKEKYPGGMYLAAEDTGKSLRSIKTVEGELIMIGGEHHKTGQGKDTSIHYETLADYANEIFTVEDIPYRWSAQDCMTLDDIPYVGHFSLDTPNLYIATGFGKWGMTNSTASAVILADLIIKGESPWQQVYSPSRSTIMASAKNFVVESFDVGKQLLGGKLSALPEETEVKRGEGKVIVINGNRTGAYRDDKGSLHLVNTTCTHLGCELNWNSAERSWDCPCHGSRFSIDGNIIEGPAVRPLSAGNDVNTIEKLFEDNF
jgi:glycine/D-amino acid oxidase-like deaminating enzyme/nitrite reductase/ring-hydroxylating ferredoxin subunit